MGTLGAGIGAVFTCTSTWVSGQVKQPRAQFVCSNKVEQSRFAQQRSQKTACTYDARYARQFKFLDTKESGIACLRFIHITKNFCMELAQRHDSNWSCFIEAISRWKCTHAEKALYLPFQWFSVWQQIASLTCIQVESSLQTQMNTSENEPLGSLFEYESKRTKNCAFIRRLQS